MPNFSQPLSEANNALRTGDRVAAWQKLKPALMYPSGVEMCDAEFSKSLDILCRISNGRTTTQAKAALKTAQAKPNDVQALFTVGYLLADSQLPQIAATALARGNDLAPDIPALVNELSSALAQSGHYNEAFRVLRAAETARQHDWFTRYLYAHYALMSGHIIEARQGFALLGAPVDDEATVLYDRLGGLINRSRKALETSTLDEHDDRGWHYVVAGGLITHVGDRGRLSTVNDSYELVHEGVVRAATTFDAWSMRPPVLVYSNDPSSAILAEVWHRRMGIPIRAFSSRDHTTKALFLAYDLSEAEDNFLDALATRRSGQILVSHASCWSQEFRYSSDISTYLYQQNTPPWGVERALVHDIAARIVATELDRTSLRGLAQLSTMARTIGLPSGTGNRERYLPRYSALGPAEPWRPE